MLGIVFLGVGCGTHRSYTDTPGTTKTDFNRIPSGKKYSLETSKDIDSPIIKLSIKQQDVTEVEKYKIDPTHRYIFFNGSKSDVRKMKRNFKMKLLPYPKGQNKNYDSSGYVETQSAFNF